MGRQSKRRAPVRQQQRRDFLKTTAAASIGYWVAGGVALAESKSPNEKVNIGIIGVGGKGRANINGVKGENIVALCDVDDNPVNKTLAEIEECKKANKYRDFRKMLEQEKSLDAVVVTTPDHMHAPASLMAMRMGKHVYNEKPLTRTIEEARAMAKVAAETKVVTHMGNQGHSNDSLRTIVEILQAGSLGAVTEVYTWTDRPGKYWPQPAKMWEGDNPVPATLDWDLWLGVAEKRTYNPAYCPFKWRGFWDFGTGSLGDMGCHIIDSVYWGLQLGYPVSVEAEGEPLDEENAPAWIRIHWEYAARGNQPAVRYHWLDAGNQPAKELTEGMELQKGGGSLVIGEKGKMLIGGDYGNTYKLFPQKDWEGFKPPEKTIPRTPSHYAEFINAIKEGKQTLANFAYSAQLTESVLLGNIAFRTGKKIYWDQPNMRATGVPEADQYIKANYQNGWTL